MYWKYFKYILQHKWYVFLEMCTLAKKYPQYDVILVLRGIIHDWSKFSIKEFKPYAKNFFGKDKSGFDKAWLHHQHYNKHHWNYWVVDQDNKKAVEMPFLYLLEMIADWRAMGRKFNDTAKSFYEKKQMNMILHDETRKKVWSILKED